jgi:translation initiation factor 1
MGEDEFLQYVQSRNFKVKLVLDTAGRKGKSVTIVDGLPKSELFLKSLLKALKQSCGAGGTYLMDKKDGVLEIQGDHRGKIAAFLQKHAIQVSTKQI